MEHRLCLRAPRLNICHSHRGDFQLAFLSYLCFIIDGLRRITAFLLSLQTLYDQKFLTIFVKWNVVEHQSFFTIFESHVSLEYKLQGLSCF